MDTAKPLKILRRTISWCDLPGDLLVFISKFADDDDVIRMRAVCSSWRSSVAPPQKISSFPLMLPIIKLYPFHDHDHGYFKLSASTIYHLKLAPISENVNSLRRNGWLVRVQENENGESIVVNPFGGRIDLFPPHSNTNVLNLLEFRVSEIAKGYSLQLVNTANGIPNYRVAGLNKFCQYSKVCVSSKPGDSDYDVTLVTDCHRFSHHIKLGDDEWTLKEIINEPFRKPLGCDVMEYEDHFYVIGNSCRIIKLDYSFRVVESGIAPVCKDCPCTPHLVECQQNLLLVHIRWYDLNDNRTAVGDRPFRIKVYKLDGDEPMNWLEMKDLGDSVLFICHDCCFSISVKDFPGLKGSCVYFMHKFDWEFGNHAICRGLNDFPIYVFNLEDGSVGPLVSHPDNSSILWSLPC